MTNINVPPGNPFTPRQVRILKITVIAMSALLVFGMIALVFGMARQFSRIGSKPARSDAPYVVPLSLGQGEVKEVFADRGSVVVHWQGDHIDLIISFDPQTGRELGRIQVQRR